MPFDNAAILLETLGQILDVHRRLATGAEAMVATGKENRAQKRVRDEGETRHAIKRQRHSNSPFADIAAPNIRSKT
jgi:hypothetical protein